MQEQNVPRYLLNRDLVPKYKAYRVLKHLNKADESIDDILTKSRFIDPSSRRVLNKIQFEISNLIISLRANFLRRRAGRINE